MEIKEFIEKFAEAIDVEEVETLTSDTEFRMLEEWSSLAGLSLIAMVDEEFDIALKGDDIKNSNTVKDLYDLIINKN